MISAQAIMKAAGFPEALVTFVAILSKKRENFFDFLVLCFMFLLFHRAVRKTQAN